MFQLQTEIIILGKCDFYIGKEKYWPLIFSMIGKKNSALMKAVSARLVLVVSILSSDHL